MKGATVIGPNMYGATQIDVVPVTVTLLGAFSIGISGAIAGPWPRPSAKRVCEFLLLSPGHRVLKEEVREVLFANLTPNASANALRKALSMARQALAPLGEVGRRLLRADRDHVGFSADIPLEIDFVTHETALRSGIAMGPGGERDAALSAALLQCGVLLDNEPYSDWALEPREALERLRQRARLELARDRTNGHGRCQFEEVIDSWEACMAHDSASEEIAANLMMSYAALGQRQLVARTYLSCLRGLQDLDLKPSLALERAYEAGTKEDGYFTAPWARIATELGNAPYADVFTDRVRGDASMSDQSNVAC